MAWTAPRTYVAGEIITASILNTHIRDNLLEVIRRDGLVPLTANWDAGSYEIRAETLESDVTTGTAPLTIASTTVVTNLNADQVDGQSRAININADHTHQSTGAEAGKLDHGLALDGLTDDDHTQYQKEDLLTTQGDIPYATAASTWARLPKGAANVFLRMNAGATAPEWAAANTASSKLITVTRDTSTASGNVAYTGAGFQPNSLVVVGAGGAGGSGVGACDSALTEQGNWTNFGFTAWVSGFIYLETSGGGTQTATVASLDADGFTLAWTKVGADSGSRTVYVLCQA